MSEKKPRRKLTKDFDLLKNPAQRARGISNIMVTLNDLPVNEEWSVTISPARERRRKIQERLHHRWCGIWEKHCGHQPGYGHAHTKLHILLPLKLSYDHEPTVQRAEIESEIISSVVDYKRKLLVAYDFIRSKDIPMKLYRDFLEAQKYDAAEQNCILTASEEMIHEAMMMEVEG